MKFNKKAARRGYVMENGRITLEGTAESLLHIKVFALAAGFSPGINHSL